MKSQIPQNGYYLIFQDTPPPLLLVPTNNLLLLRLLGRPTRTPGRSESSGACAVNGLRAAGSGVWDAGIQGLVGCVLEIRAVVPLPVIVVDFLASATKVRTKEEEQQQ